MSRGFPLEDGLMRVRWSPILCLAAACLLACTSGCVEVQHIIKPATECPAEILFATFRIAQGCTDDCPYPWHCLSKKIEGEWVVQGTGCDTQRDHVLELHLEPGEYKLEAACHNSADENWPPESGWRLCAYLTSWVAELEVRRKGSTANWGGSTNVAAGGKDPDVHKADVRVTATPALAGLPVTVLIAEGTGGGKPGTGGAATVTVAPQTGTDGIASGTFISSNRTEDVRLILKPTDVDYKLDTAVIHQGWARKIGDAWEHEEYFTPGVADPVSLKLELADGPDLVPILGHTVKFYAWRVTYYEWDDSTQQFEPREETICPDNFWDLSYFCAFNPPSTQDSGNTGVYSTAMTVKEDPYWYVDEADFWRIDDCVYE